MTNPFFTDTTLPDGTTRGPIVERVEACRPKNINGDVLTLLKTPSRRGDKEYLDFVWGLGSFPVSVRDQEARALSRVAVEEWVIGYGGLTIGRRSKDCLVFLERESDDWGNVRNITAAGPKRESALNLLAHHLADALGLPQRKGGGG